MPLLVLFYIVLILGKKNKKIMVGFRKYIRFQRHKNYIEKRVLELRSKITIEAIETGCADELTRTLFLKYNDYLKNIIKNTN